MAEGVRSDEEFSGTKPVEERHRIDEARLDGWMREHVEGYQGPLTVLQFKGGQSNPTYRLDTPDRSYVMRRKPFGKLLPSAHAVDREFRVIAALGKQGFPVAKAYALCTDDAVIGAAFYIMSMEEGRVFWDPTLPSQTPRGAARDLHQQDRDAGETAHLRSAGDRPWRVRQARQLFRAPGRSLDQAIPRLRNPAHSGSRKADRVAAAHRAAAGARLDRAWRLSPRQHDLPRHRAAGDRGAGLGTLDARRSHGRLHLSLDAMDHAGSRQCRPQGAEHSDAWKRPRRSIATSPAARCRISTGIFPTICFGSPASRKASPAASATAPRPAPRRWNRPRAPCRCRRRPGTTRRRRGRCEQGNNRVDDHPLEECPRPQSRGVAAVTSRKFAGRMS